eukprot:12356448-Prorocentrum_lima.AAC.1
MTSSLVGSEMCIRDRPYGGGEDFGKMASSLPTNGKKASGRRRAPSPCTVSYTHLTLPTICSV